MVSVTEVLDYFTEPSLLAWMLREGKAKCERISQEAKAIGTAVDLMIRQDIQGAEYSLANPPAEVTNCLQAWQRFKEAHPLFVSQVTGLQTELTDGELVGHPDLEITEAHRWGIVDIKTSKAIQPRHWLQVAKYWHLKGKQSPMPSPFTSFIGILRLDKVTAQYEYQELSDPPLLFEEVRVFEAYYTAYQHGQKIQEVMRQLKEQEMLDVT